ncbi:MAG: 23S rRNA (guanosine(2251)-2'-O)-methyltransferase RlmB [Rhodospirillales bacterium]|nr:23S rRNA (guanosine(2251)-2'-O)-methyltransferase RlmB [Rhodospirillales bacterium]
MQKRKKFPKARRHPPAGPEPRGAREATRPTAGAPPPPRKAPPQGEGFRPRRDHGPASRKAATGDIWLYGIHAVCAALANPARRVRRLLVTEGAAEPIRRAAEAAPGGRPPIALETVERAAIDALFPSDTVHQGAALLVPPLDAPALEDVLDTLSGEKHALVVVLDQVDDPRNVGAVMRSAAAFGASALIVPERHAPAESGALAKAASGALEIIPMVRVTNIARTLEALKRAGFWCIGLAPEGDQDISPPARPSPVALVLGAEGSGLRRLTLDRCDEAARIPLAGPIASLNLSAAAAIALFAYRACARRTGGAAPSGP